MSDLQAQLDAEADGFAGTVGYAVANLSTGERLSRRADELFPTASSIKLPILTAFHEFVEGGGASWDDVVPIDRELSFGGSGVLQSLHLPQLSYRDIAWLMICLSDNLATNLLLQPMTIEHTNERLRHLVGDGILINNYAGFNSNVPGRTMGSATPGALGRYLVDLAEGTLPGSAETIEVALQQLHQETIHRYLPADPFSPGALKIAAKGGSMPGVRTAVAILTEGERQVAVAFMIKDAQDLTGGVENESEKTVGRMTRLVYDAWMNTAERMNA